MKGGIFLTLATGFLVGISYASVTVPADIILGTMLISGAVACVAAYRLDERGLLVPLLCSGFVFGALYMDACRVVPDPVLIAHEGGRIEIRGTIAAEPDVRDRTVRLTVDVSHMSDEMAGGRVLVIAPAHTEASYGDAVVVSGVLRAPESFESGEGRIFNYPKFLEGKGITHEIAFADVTVVASGGGNPIIRAGLAVKAAYIAGLRSALPEPYAGLAGGITAGDKRSVGEELTGVFQSVSLVHILVLSGYNITIVLIGLSRITDRLSKRIQLVLTGVIVTFFFVISGGASSATRAGSMAYLGVYARLTGRLFQSLRVLYFVGCAMVVWNPYVLMFDPGFQLSFLATAGLIVFTPVIARRLTFMTERFGFREIVASTMATQTTVLPLLLYQGGLLSIVSLPANAFVLIAVPFAMAASFIAAIGGMLFGTYGALFAFPAYVLLAYIISTAELFASLPVATVDIPAFSAWILVAAYAVLAYAAYKSEQPAHVPAVQGETKTV